MSVAKVIAFYAEVVRLYEALTPEERAELERWEATYVTGSGEYGSSDWPGFRPKFSPETLAWLDERKGRQS